MNNHQHGIQLHLPALAENVSLVRHALVGAGESLGMSEAVLADLKTVVTEACMNAVLHAYDGEPGPLEVSAWPEDDQLVVVVRDFGAGIKPRADTDRPSLKLGLSLIAAMTSGFELSGGAGRGTTVTMRLSFSDAEAVSAAPVGEQVEEEQENRMVLTAWNAEQLEPILARVVSVLAARSDLSIDRLSDAVLFSDALSEDLARLNGSGAIRLTVDTSEDGFDLSIGPLAAGMAEDLKEGLYLPAELGGSLESLADRVEVVPVGADDGSELLLISFGGAARRTR